MKTKASMRAGAPSRSIAQRRSGIRSAAAMVVLAGAGVMLGGCAGYRTHSVTVGAVPQDYRTNHPIIISEKEQTLDIPVASGDHKLPTAVRETVRGYAQRYDRSASGSVRVMVPTGSLNAGAASIVSGQVRDVLVDEGVPATRIIVAPYRVARQGDAAPIHLSFSATAASTTPCGRWPEDLVSDTSENRNYANFGCASQNNLAAQIANPSDLLAPRGMTPIEAERRKNVYDNYVQNGSSATGK